MSINKLVNIREAVFDATEDMGIDVSSQIPLMTNWALKAEKKIGSYYGWKKKRAVLDVKGCTAALPIGAMAVQFVVHGDHGCDCEELVGNVSRWASSFDASSNEVFLVIDYPELGSTTSCYGNDWETQDNKLVFKDNMDGDKVTIQYLGYECDEDGFIRIN